mgnify:CR=1 FL=1
MLKEHQVPRVKGVNSNSSLYSFLFRSVKADRYAYQQMKKAASELHNRHPVTFALSTFNCSPSSITLLGSSQHKCCPVFPTHAVLKINSHIFLYPLPPKLHNQKNSIRIYIFTIPDLIAGTGKKKNQ